jgi:TolB protein
VIRTLQSGQRCEVWIASVSGESAAWCTPPMTCSWRRPTGPSTVRALILNGDGKLWRFDLAAVHPSSQFARSGVPDLNNDHVLDPDGKDIFLSANDGHIYRARWTAEQAVRITEDDGSFHFLHGVTPDGAGIGVRGNRGRRLHAAGPADDHSVRRRRAHVAAIRIDVGPATATGPNTLRTAKWLYLNTESFTSRCPVTPNLPACGRRQVQRRTADSSGSLNPTRSTGSRISPPMAAYASYIRFPSGTEGHPADLPVAVVLVSTEDWATPLHTWPLFGGQGTLNVNSWSPDSRALRVCGVPAR